jgi:hypothetical protein
VGGATIVYRTRSLRDAASWRYDGLLCVGDGETGAREDGTQSSEFESAWDTVNRGCGGAASLCCVGLLCVGDGETGARQRILHHTVRLTHEMHGRLLTCMWGSGNPTCAWDSRAGVLVLV